jgi:hypothetical protein
MFKPICSSSNGTQDLTGELKLSKGKGQPTGRGIDNIIIYQSAFPFFGTSPPEVMEIGESVDASAVEG